MKLVMQQNKEVCKNTFHIVSLQTFTVPEKLNWSNHSLNHYLV